MPKFVLLSHAFLLLVLSALLSPCVVGILGGAAELPRNTVLCLAVVALILGAVLLITEVFSGVRWAAVAAFAGVATGLAAMFCRSEVAAVSMYAWGVAWVAVVGWFASLAYRARSNR